MPIRRRRRNATAWRAHEKSLLNEIRLEDVLNGIAFLAQGGSETLHTHRSTIEFFNDREQQSTIHGIETVLIDFQHGERALRHIYIDSTGAFDLRVIAHAPQQTVHDTRRAPGAASNQGGARRRHLRTQLFS